MREQIVGLQPAAADTSEVRDYWLLLKPNVMSLVVFSAAAGLYLAPGSLHPVLAFVAAGVSPPADVVGELVPTGWKAWRQDVGGPGARVLI